MREFSAVILLLIFIFVGCHNHSDQASPDELKHQVESARWELKQVENSNDSLTEALALLDNRINEILLLSKDVENPEAATVVGNRFFETAFEDLDLKGSQRVLLTPRMNNEE